MQNLTTRHTAAALAQAGYMQEAGALRAAAKLCRRAAVARSERHEATSSGAVASLLSLPKVCVTMLFPSGLTPDFPNL